ncbi:MAG TPA: MBL fold metallo-hydrolase [Candidatus Angelobacter sp.]|nr:MBL fold metallo-hydrolase [Candidatus Angelobacter sp.]
MKFHRFEVPGLSHYSYLVGCGGKAVIVDPKRDVDTYISYAAGAGLKITHILETHIHADFASGALELAEETGAQLWLSNHDDGEHFQYRFPHNKFSDGEDLRVGNVRLTALHTPGHTPEHLSFLIYDENRCSQPKALLSGDFVFVGSLGRPDLLGEGAKRKLAESLFESVHRKIAGLPDGLEICPAHGAGSMCGSGMSESAQSTLGYERVSNIYFADRDRQKFVDRILGTVPPFPDYYRRMKQVNSDGPALLRGLPGDRALELQDFRGEVNVEGAVVVDLRRPEAFGGAHIPGSFNIGAGPSLSTWAAWALPYGSLIFLVGDERSDYREAIRSLIRVGLDDIRGYLQGGIRTWIEAGLPQDHVPQISVEELARRIEKNAYVLDVRGDNEWNSGHIGSAAHIMAGELAQRAHELPRNERIHAICGSGYRSSLATSILKRSGLNEVVNVSGGMGGWNAMKFPVVR